ncbi:hypothetical protein RRG08_054066 [Elysia crispata]|uniref:Uncharacterized protein n=1 Tax=Elysia crispata TaxID=231223 RepID=A0AAE0ZCN5_9GAST|nr:hypothetical protein RRG08_054066 [Elysia crispata]
MYFSVAYRLWVTSVSQRNPKFGPAHECSALARVCTSCENSHRENPINRITGLSRPLIRANSADTQCEACFLCYCQLAARLVGDNGRVVTCFIKSPAFKLKACLDLGLPPPKSWANH